MQTDLDQVLNDLMSDLEAEQRHPRGDRCLCYSLKMAIGGIRLAQSIANGDQPRIWEERTRAAPQLSYPLFRQAREIVRQRAA